MNNKDNTRLLVYTLQNCIYCNDLKGKLKILGINYREIIITNNNDYNSLLGDTIEMKYKTESYPILEIRNQHNSQILYSFISKTNLEEQEGIFIFDTIEQIINKLKQFYEI